MLARRRTCKLLWFGGALLLVGAWRVDQSVKTAYAAGWVRPGGDHGCVHCARLPSALWDAGWLAAGLLGVAMLTGATWSWRARSFRSRPPDSKGLLIWTAAMTALAAVAATAAAWLRLRAGTGYGQGGLTWVRLVDLVALAAVAGIAVAHANAGLTAAAAAERAEQREHTSAGLTLIVGSRRFLQRQGVNVLAVLALAALLTLVGQTHGQAVDSIRTWTFEPALDRARLAFGLASTLLLSLVVYEGATRLAQTETRHERVPTRRWLHLAAGLVAAELLVRWRGGTGRGLLVAAAGALLLAALDYPWREPPASPCAAGAQPRSPLATAARPDPLQAHEQGDVLAAVPLLAVGATAVAAYVEGALSAGVQVAPLGVALATVALAVLCTRETAESPLVAAERSSWAAIGVAVAVAGLVALFAGNADVAAAVGFAALALLVAYAAWVFLRPTGAKRATLSAQFATASGLILLVAVVASPFRTSVALGTFALVDVGLAALLVAAHMAVRATILHAPPRALHAIGMEQLPVVTAIALVWIVSGFVLPPRIHDLRLVDRPLVETGDRLPPAPGLDAVFASWRHAQPELASGAPAGAGRTIPLLLVASHGGGIRAAYWTALALDCMVAGDATADEPACGGRRRSGLAQQRAARRIMVASGVSGGAVGLYAYARQLLSAGSLTRRPATDWIDRRLGRDFASAAIGWAVFHDLPNHLLGFRHDRGAVIEESFDRVWPDGGPAPYLRHVWDLRSSSVDGVAHRRALAVPLLVTNATVTGGETRVDVSAANLSRWPGLDGADAAAGKLPDPRPLAGSPDVSDTLCAASDLRLSTAALLGARFPYVTPSGRLEGGCPGGHPADADSACRTLGSVCTIEAVDGGYADNSGLFTLIELWPSLRRLVTDFNRSADANGYRVAPVVVELDNHYRPPLTPVRGAGTSRQTLVPPLTALGARHVVETYSRADAYRIAPAGCVFTISPGLHPGLTAPLGWELSPAAQAELRAGLRAPHADPHDLSEQNTARGKLRTLQRLLDGLGASDGPLAGCVPR